MNKRRIKKTFDLKTNIVYIKLLEGINDSKLSIINDEGINETIFFDKYEAINSVLKDNKKLSNERKEKFNKNELTEDVFHPLNNRIILFVANIINKRNSNITCTKNKFLYISKFEKKYYVNIWLDDLKYEKLFFITLRKYKKEKIKYVELLTKLKLEEI